MIYTSRSKYQLGLNCKQARAWAYEYGGKGIQLRKVRIPLAVGTAVHCLSEALRRGELEGPLGVAKEKFFEEVSERGLEVENDDIVESLANEQWALAEGLLRGWWRVRRPAFEGEFEVVSVEEESVVVLAPPVEREGVALQTRSDMVVRRRTDGSLFVWSWKTTGYVDSEWQTKWDHDVQRMTETLGDQERLGQPIAGVIVEGLFKGRKVPKDKRAKRVVYGEFGGPLAWGWKKETASGTVYSPGYERGYTEFPVWLEEFKGCPEGMGSVEYWVGWLPEEVLQEQFIVTLPLLTDQVQLERAKEDIVVEERVLSENVDYRPRNYNFCHKYAGSSCPFVGLCFDEVAAENPLESGRYVWAERNHPEMEGE